MFKKGDVVIYNGNRLTSHIGQSATVVEVGKSLATIRFTVGGEVYDSARLTHLSKLSGKKFGISDAVVGKGNSIIAWGLKNKETGEIWKETFCTRDEAKSSKSDDQTFIKVQITEVK